MDADRFELMPAQLYPPHGKGNVLLGEITEKGKNRTLRVYWLALRLFWSISATHFPAGA
jgi:hypothetical protein